MSLWLLTWRLGTEGNGSGFVLTFRRRVSVINERGVDKISTVSAGTKAEPYLWPALHLI